MPVSGFPGGSEVKASACNVGDLASIPGLGRSLGKGNGNPFQYSCLVNPMDAGAWWATVHGVAKSQTWLSDFTSACFNLCYEGCKMLIFNFWYSLHLTSEKEKAMATHSSSLAWRRLWSMGSWRVFHFSLSRIREGNGNPLQYYCLENPMDGVAW